MESRIEILDRLAHKWSRNNPECVPVDTFDEWLKIYDSDATIKLVYQAMLEYNKPVKPLTGGTSKRCTIEQYDTTITEPPYLTIKLDEVRVDQPETDDGGVIFAERLRLACLEKGYRFKFYYMARAGSDADYKIVVY